MAKPRDEYRFEPIDTQKDTAVGIGLPFSGRNGLFQLNYTTEKQAISNLKNLLLTRKGERMMQPEFGWIGWDILFEQNTPDLVERLKRGTGQDIGYWLPYINIEELKVTPRLVSEGSVDYGHGITVSLVVSVEPSRANTTITLELTSTGGVTIQEG
jgi:phage baseplate assembly protein W